MLSLPTIPWPAAFAVGAALVSLSAVLLGRSRVRVALSCLVWLCSLAVPWLAPAADLFPRALIALLTMLPALRIIDLVRDPRDWSAAHRIWQFISPFDARETSRVAARVDVRAFGAALLQCAVCAAMIVLVQASPDLAPRSLGLAVRLAAGAAGTYTLVGGFAALTLALYRCAGVDFPPLQRMPIASRSVQEFWGERWNRTINRWLRRNCFAPLARRRAPRLGVVAAFTASALVHVWIVLAPLGATMALSMGCYFLVEAALLLIEAPLRVRRWPRPLQHTWTILAVAGPSPLFIVPMTALLL